MGMWEVKSSGKQCRELEPICINTMWIAVLSHGVLKTPSTHSKCLTINDKGLSFRQRIEGLDLLFEIWDDFRVEKRCKCAKLQGKNSTPRIGVSGKPIPVRPQQKGVKNERLLNV